MSGSLLHVLAPGLLGPLPAQAAADVRLDGPGAAPAELLLSRARRPTPVSAGLSQRLVQLLDEQGATAVGPACALGDGLHPGRHVVFCADPVHLVPDRDQLRVMSPGPVSLTPADRRSLQQDVQGYFADEGFTLEVQAAGGWYLFCDPERAPRLDTAPLEQVLGTSLRDGLPDGPDAAHWIRHLNAIQMLLHASPLNVSRQAAGLPPVSGVWLWGGGALPANGVRSRFRAVFSHDALARGLAAAAGIPCEPPETWHGSAAVDQASGQVLLQTEALVPVTDAESFARWQHQAGAWCDRWAPVLLQLLRRRSFARICLESEGRRFLLGPHSLRAFWRRPRPFRHWLVAA